jgi:hypothetical protein
MFNQIFKYRPLQRAVLFWHECRQPYKAHKAELELLEEDFYISLLKQSSVREAISKLCQDAEKAASRNSQSYKVPHSTWLIVELNKSIQPNAENDAVANAVQYLLRGRREHRKVLLWWFLAGLAILLLRSCLGINDG